MSNSIIVAFFSEQSQTISPAIYLRYGYDDIQGSIDDALPRLITGNPTASAAQFVACWADWVSDPTCVDIFNMSDSGVGSTWDQTLASARQAADALVDVDEWILHFQGTTHALQGERAKTTEDLERRERWPRFLASFAFRITALFRNR